MYKAICSNQPSPLAELPIQYADFAAWQREWLQGEVLESQLSYWKKQLEGKLPVINLPTDKPSPDVQTFQGARRSLILPESLTKELKSFSQKQEVTLFTTLLAGFYILINWYTQQEDIIIGTDVANRNFAEIEGLIGFFINQLVLRTKVSDNSNFQEFLMQVLEVTLGAYSHQSLPFSKLVEVINPDRDLSRHPIFQVKFVLQNTPMPPLEIAGLTITVLDDVDNGTVPLDLLLDMIETDKGMAAMLKYNTDLFNVNTIDNMLKNYVQVLTTIIQSPNSTILEIKNNLEELPTFC